MNDMESHNSASDLVTVVVPVYNMSQYLDRAMNSLLNQTYRNYEILMVDDGSTDGGSEKCDAYAASYDNVTALHKENGGLSSARNCGIKNARGKYIIFPDPDDWVTEDYLQGLVDLREQNSDLEVCGHYVVTGNNMNMHSPSDKCYRYNREEALKSAMLASGFCGFAWNKMYHMNIIRENSLQFDEELGMAQDLHFLIRYLMRCNHITYRTRPLYFYFQHVGGVTNAPLSPRKISGLITYSKIAEITQNEYPEIAKMAKATYANMSLHFIYIYYEQQMEDEALLRRLKNGFKSHMSYILKCENYGMTRKVLCVVAGASPKASYLMRKIAKRGDNHGAI